MPKTPRTFMEKLRAPLINDVSTRQDKHYPHLAARTYQVPLERAVNAAASISAAEQTAWRVQEQSENRVHLIRTTRLMRYKDDVYVDVEDAGEEGVRVHVRSKSRLGKGDFGQNAINIEELQAHMDRYLG